MVKNKRVAVKLKLGQMYTVQFGSGDINICKFIQPTRCGFNFLNFVTNKCILRQHLYPSKCENHKSGDWFFINKYIKIEEFNDSKLFF